MRIEKFVWKIFLQALGEQVWQVVEVGWIKPKEVPVDWDEATIIVANFNSREFKRISSKEVSKEAWTILKTTCEGTKVVKIVKL